MMWIHSKWHVLFTEGFSPSMKRACLVQDTAGDTEESQWAIAVLPHRVHKVVRRQIKGTIILR